MRIRWLPFFVCGVLLSCGIRLHAAGPESGPDALAPDSGPVGPATRPTTSPAIPRDVALAVAQLGDDDPQARDAAGRKLNAMGKSALPALREAANGDDPEVANRARRLLAGFRYGIDPDTPASLMQLVSQYRGGQGQARLQVIQQLSAMNWAGYRVLARLHRQESDPTSRAALEHALQVGRPNVLGGVREMILAGKEDDAEARLYDAASGGDGLVLRGYAALLLARGRLDESIREIRGDVGDTPDADDALLLALMYRAKGDADNALRYARQVPASAPAVTGIVNEGEELVREVLLDRHDWASLIADADKRAGDASNPLLRRDALAEKLSYARLAGDAKSFDEALDAIREAAGQFPDLASIYGTALLVNDRAAEGIDLLVKGKDYARAYHLMISQGRYEDATKLLADAKSDGADHLSALELNNARRLTWLGDKDAASAIVDRFEREIAADSADPSQGDLIESELELGRTDKAFDRAMAAIASSAAVPNNVNSVQQLLARIVPNAGPQALAWRGYLEDQHPGTAPAEILHTIWALYSRKLPPAEAESLLRGAAANAAGQRPADRMAIYERLTQTAAAIGRPDLADRVFEKWAAEPAGAIGGWFPWKILGDHALARKDYPRAVECYGNALQRSSREPICLWLHGYATFREAADDAEKADKGKEEMRRADEYLLADGDAWLRFIEAIGQAGADAAGDVETQRELMRRVGEPGLGEVSESYRLSARALLPPSDNPDEMEVPDTTDAPEKAGPRYLRSADLLSRWMTWIIQSNRVFIVPEMYLMQPAFIHSLHARGLIATGDIPAAMKEADLALSALPANSQLPIDLVPALDRQGHKPEADELFRKVAGTVQASLDRHPQCAELHNGFAWMCAKCDRELDKALANAREAAKLTPDSVAFLDTLAEVQFHRGDRQAAVATMKHCIELDSHFEYLQHQLKRFTAGETPATQP